tara:strand:+ start:35 stop:538 length:504 start_codon:yes stop_codon:yes gene_type:complete
MSRLFNCKDCDKEISPSAKSCPNCGRKIKLEDIPFSKMDVSQKIRVIATSLFSLAILYVLANIFFFNNDAPQKEVLSLDKKSEVISLIKNENLTKIKDLFWSKDENILNIIVNDDGTNRRGYAISMCEIIRSGGIEALNVDIHIIDNKSWVSNKDFKILGIHKCEID